jgi:hypothetical protein
MEKPEVTSEFDCGGDGALCPGDIMRTPMTPNDVTCEQLVPHLTGRDQGLRRLLDRSDRKWMPGPFVDDPT